MRALQIVLFFIVSFFGCKSQEKKEEVKHVKSTEKDTIHTVFSKLKNEYIGFNSPKAINKIAAIENEYFSSLEQNGVSKYYGTVWRQEAEKVEVKEATLFDEYLKQLNKKADSMHCTIYAVKALRAGLLEKDVKKVDSIHKKIWKKREYAGWSVGYILVKYFNWKAYLVLDEESKEYNHCLKSFNKDKTYPVWKQPNIPLENYYIRGKNNKTIDSLLMSNEFSWGFSEQGIHTWVTRFNKLKECYWAGAPSKETIINNDKKPLFITTNFLNYIDYNSHIIIFPPKKSK